MRYLLIAILFLTANSCGTTQEITQVNNKPNFIIFLVDDLGWNGGQVFGSDLYETPNIDRLAADGMRFSAGYAACTVCSPSRAAMLTGKYPARTHVTDWIRGHQRPYAKLRVPDWTMRIEERHTTIAEALAADGYRTASVGKWHLMPSGEPDMNDYLPEEHGFEVNVGGNERGEPGSYFHPYSHPTEAHRRIGPLPSGGEEGEYLTDRLSDEAIKLIDGFGDDPFLLYFSFYSVHTPIQAKEADIEHYKPLIKEGMLHTDPVYASMVTSVDRAVGLVRTKLQEVGAADNTVIIFTGDNGGLDRDGTGRPTDNGPLREGKGSAYEGGVRTPAVVYWPGVTLGSTVSNEPVITVDYYPTILDIAGIEGDESHNAEVDGLSLVPILRDPDASLGRESLYWHYPHYHIQGASPHSAIRAGDWRLVEFFEDGHAELYNLREDIGEANNLAVEMPEKVTELKAKLAAWRSRVGAQMPTENPDYDLVKDRQSTK